MSKTPGLNRRRFCGVAAATVAAGPHGLLGMFRSVNGMTDVMTEVETGSEKSEIRPFHVSVADADVAELRRRINATRWPDRETVRDDSQGVPLEMMQGLARHWGSNYDWRKVEARLNALPQFITTIDGLDIHFIHVRSKHENALPLIVTHGWPGSVIEQMKIIDPLTNPTGHGASASDAFHLVIPSMPGHGFSGRPTTTGWDPTRIARAWVVLMDRLGYKKYVAQGGDWGSMVTDLMGAQAAPGLLGVHNSMPGTVPADIAKSLQCGDPAPAGLSADEKLAYEQLKNFYATGVAYALEMGTRPQTLYGIVDSPVGLAAWLLDHGDGYAQPAASFTSAVLGRTVNGHPAGAMTRDDVLDNISLYWFTNTATSASRLYWENKINFFAPKNVRIPVAVTVFPGELYQAPKSWAEKAYPKLIHYNRVAKGGHFAAWEQPQLFSEEVRAGLRSLRS